MNRHLEDDRQEQQKTDNFAGSRVDDHRYDEGKYEKEYSDIRAISEQRPRQADAYLHNRTDDDPRRERFDPYAAEPDHYRYAREAYGRDKRRWYNQGWVWLIVTVLGIAVIAIVLNGVTQELGHVDHSIQQQTQAINKQSSILHAINHHLGNLTHAVSYGFQSLVTAVKDLANTIMSASK